MTIEIDQRKTTGSQSFATELGRYNNLDVSSEQLLPHEQMLLQALDKFGRKRLEKRRKEAQRLLRENGATHNLFDPVAAPRSWQFDPIPLIIANEEWTRIEAGLIQRAELLDLILADIYGPRKLIEKGLLPPELVFTHKGFLWPCTDLLPAGERSLNLYSATLARAKDGRYWVLEDHPQPLFGSGYALENRIVMTRSFPQLYQGFHIHRLDLYFRALRNRLAFLARHNQAEPRIVVLTPGPEHARYFEHAYLASYLGYSLVQGGDLIVRDGCVWLKSVGGLQQVDVILHRLDDELCDPLELRGDSISGVPGLLEAIRLGNVRTGNFLGSNVLNNPALLAFLPAISRFLLGEELRLPSVATWWCGQPREREFVLQNLDKLVIRPINSTPGFPIMSPEQLNRGQLSSLRDKIVANPHLYVGQELARLATSPTFVTDEIEQQPCILSTFLVAQGQSYVAMPGGLARVAKESSSLLISKTGGYSKDTWVLTTEPHQQVNLWRQAQPDEWIEAGVSTLSSRAAENLFWAGRYAERAEATARLIRSILGKLREFDEFRDADDRRSLEHLLQALTRVTSTYPGFVGEGAAAKLADPRAELMSLSSDVERPGSLRSLLRSFAYSAYIIRDILPVDAWRIVDNIQHNWNPKFSISFIGSGRLHDSINQLLVQLSAFSGLNNDNMARETDWLLLKIGRSLERALNLIALLRATLVPYYQPSMEAQMFETVLSTSNSLITYRRRYRSFMQLPSILELLLADENYPRAFAYQLHQLQRMIKELPHDQSLFQTPDVLLISEVLTALRRSDLKQLAQLSINAGSYSLLEEFLTEQKERLEKLSEALMQLYFSPTLALQRLDAMVQGKAS